MYMVLFYCSLVFILEGLKIFNKDAISDDRF
jgi:hypothetical protein